MEPAGQGRLGRLALNDEGFAFDPTRGESYVLNETALRIIRACQKGGSGSEIARELEQAYQVPAAEAEADVAEFMERLRSLGLL